MNMHGPIATVIGQLQLRHIAIYSHELHRPVASNNSTPGHRKTFFSGQKIWRISRHFSGQI